MGDGGGEEGCGGGGVMEGDDGGEEGDGRGEEGDGGGEGGEVRCEVQQVDGGVVVDPASAGQAEEQGEEKPHLLGRGMGGFTFTW